MGRFPWLDIFPHAPPAESHQPQPPSEPANTTTNTSATDDDIDHDPPSSLAEATPDTNHPGVVHFSVVDLCRTSPAVALGIYSEHRLYLSATPTEMRFLSLEVTILEEAIARMQGALRRKQAPGERVRVEEELARARDACGRLKARQEVIMRWEKRMEEVRGGKGGVDPVLPQVVVGWEQTHWSRGVPRDLGKWASWGEEEEGNQASEVDELLRVEIDSVQGAPVDRN